jgi:hypothetical protein
LKTRVVQIVDVCVRGTRPVSKLAQCIEAVSKNRLRVGSDKTKVMFERKELEEMSGLKGFQISILSRPQNLSRDCINRGQMVSCRDRTPSDGKE